MPVPHSEEVRRFILLFLCTLADSDENAIDCENSCDCVKRANVIIGLRKEIFARTHTGTHKPTSAQRLLKVVAMMTPDNRLWSPQAYGLQGNNVMG